VQGQAEANFIDLNNMVGPTPCRDVRTVPATSGAPVPPSFTDGAMCTAAGAGFSVATTAAFEYTSDARDVIDGGTTAQALSSASLTFHVIGDTTGPDDPPPTGGTVARALASAVFGWRPLSPVKFHLTVTPDTGAPFLGGVTIALSGPNADGQLRMDDERVLNDTLPRDATFTTGSDLALTISVIVLPAGRTTLVKASDLTVTVVFSDADGS
jgi:hypothetical protein